MVPPVIDQEYVAPAVAGTEAEFPVDPTHTVEAAVIVELGVGLTVTVSVQVLWQLLPSVTVSVSVKEAPVPAVTLTDWLVVEPTIVPPETDQLYPGMLAGPE
jgi:hypothetical protein